MCLNIIIFRNYIHEKLCSVQIPRHIIYQHPALHYSKPSQLTGQVAAATKPQPKQRQHSRTVQPVAECIAVAVLAELKYSEHSILFLI